MNSKSIIQVGIAFILLGIVAFTYQRSNDSVGDSAVEPVPAQAIVEAKNAIPVSYILGGVVILVGIVLVAVGVKKSPH